MSTYDLIKVEKKVNLPYAKDKIFSDLKRVCEVGVAKYNIAERNDTFGTLKISIISGLLVVFVEITLSEIDDNNTSFSLSAHNATGSRATQAFIDGAVGDFLKLVEMQLKGEEVTSDIVKQTAGGTGWFWILIAIIGIIIIWYLIWD